MERSLAPNPLRPRDALTQCAQALAVYVAFERMASYDIQWPEDTAPQAFNTLETLQQTLRDSINLEIVEWARSTNRLWNQAKLNEFMDEVFCELTEMAVKPSGAEELIQALLSSDLRFVEHLL